MLAAVDVKNDIPVTGFQGNGQSTAQNIIKERLTGVQIEFP